MIMESGMTKDLGSNRANPCFRTKARIVVVAAIVAIATAQAAGLKDGELSPPLGPLKQERRSETIIYVNGQYTTSDEARRDAALIAQKLNSAVRLVYNDLTWDFVDWFSTAIEKMGNADLSVNAATRTLIECIQGRIVQGNSVYLIGHSAGSLSILNAVRAVERIYRLQPTAQRKLHLSRIHVLSIGGATFNEENVFADRWPEFLGSAHHLYDIRDGVANVWGEGNFFDWFDCELGDFHSITGHYVKYVTHKMLASSGTTTIEP